MSESINECLDLAVNLQENIVEISKSDYIHTSSLENIAEQATQLVTLLQEIKENEEDCSRASNQVGCWQQLCNCPCPDSDFRMSIRHKKHCPFW